VAGEVGLVLARQIKAESRPSRDEEKRLSHLRTTALLNEKKARICGKIDSISWNDGKNVAW